MYKRLGFGKKKGKGVVVGKLEAVDVDGAEDLLVGGSILVRDLLELLVPVDILLLLTEVTTFVSAVLVAVAPSAASIPANEGKPRPARFAKSEFVRLILLKFPRFPKPPKAPRLGKPPKGIKRGLFLGSKLPSERPERRELLMFEREGKFRLEAIDVAARFA